MTKEESVKPSDKADARRKRQRARAATRKAVQTVDQDDLHRMRKRELLRRLVSSY